MRVSIVYIEEVELGFELLIGGTREEVKAAVKSQNRICLLNYGTDGSHADNIVVSLAVRETAKESGGIVNRKSLRVYEVKLNTALFGFLFATGSDGRDSNQSTYIIYYSEQDADRH